MTQFQALCDHLNLKGTQIEEKNLVLLKEWCVKNISKEINIKGTKQQEYKAYRALAKNYLDNFLVYRFEKDFYIGMDQLNGMNGIQYAAYYGYDRFLCLPFLFKIATLDLVDSYGSMTALHYAAIKGNFHAVQALLNAGASPLIPSKSGLFPLHCAFILPLHQDKKVIENKIKIAQLLEEQSQNIISEIDDEGQTIAHLVCENGFSFFLPILMEKYPNLLLVKNHFGRYPIHAAILNNRLQMVQILIQMKETLSLVDSENRNALHYAAKYGNERLMQICCQEEQYLDSMDENRKTPLMIAAEAGNFGVLRVLIKHKADPYLQDSQGYTMFNYASQSGNKSMIDWILEKVPPFKEAPIRGSDIKNNFGFYAKRQKTVNVAISGSYSVPDVCLESKTLFH